MKIIITEEQFKRFNKSSPALQNGIIKYLNHYIEDGHRKIYKKSRFYGNLREDWCVDGLETITAIYYFDDNKFNSGTLLISKDIVNTISKLFGVKDSFINHVIEEWYDEVMVPKFEKEVGETGLYIDNIDFVSSPSICVPEPQKPEGITDEEMIEFIVKNTLYTEPEVKRKIESGERELEDFYLDIADNVESKKVNPF